MKIKLYDSTSLLIQIADCTQLLSKVFAILNKDQHIFYFGFCIQEFIFASQGFLIRTASKKKPLAFRAI